MQRKPEEWSLKDSLIYWLISPKDPASGLLRIHSYFDKKIQQRRQGSPSILKSPEDVMAADQVIISKLLSLEGSDGQNLEIS
jgi:hypothetical protein